MMRPFKGYIVLTGAALVLSACAADRPTLILSKKSAVELRSMQSRAFESNDRNKVFRGIIATFQDLGYSIRKVEPDAGTVTADKLARLTMTATAYPKDNTRMIVRANAVVKIALDLPGNQVDSPEFYLKRFFEPLSKAIFLQALQVEESDNPAVEKAEETLKNAEERERLAAELERKKAAAEKKKDEAESEQSR